MRPSPPYVAATTSSIQISKLSLEEQQLVDCARDILMRQRALNEEEAYSLLSEMADKRRTGMADISLQLINITKRLTV